jgi:hypothetical protein
MKHRRLSAQALPIEFRVRVHICSCFQQRPCALHAVILRANVQRRNSVQRSVRAPQVEFPPVGLRLLLQQFAQLHVIIQQYRFQHGIVQCRSRLQHHSHALHKTP